MKRDHGNEFRGSKNGGREVWVGLEWPETIAGPICARPAVVRREIWPARSSCGDVPPWMAGVARGWPESPPTAKTRLA